MFLCRSMKLFEFFALKAVARSGLQLPLTRNEKNFRLPKNFLKEGNYKQSGLHRQLECEQKNR